MKTRSSQVTIVSPSGATLLSHSSSHYPHLAQCLLIISGPQMLLAKSPRGRSVSTQVPKNQETISPTVEGKGGRASLHLPETMGESLFTNPPIMVCFPHAAICTLETTPEPTPQRQLLHCRHALSMLCTIQPLQCFPRGSPENNGLNSINTGGDTLHTPLEFQNVYQQLNVLRRPAIEKQV